MYQPYQPNSPPKDLTPHMVKREKIMNVNREYMVVVISNPIRPPMCLISTLLIVLYLYDASVTTA